MITENLGKIAITPKGQYVAGSYERLDLVTDNGSSYLSLKDNNVSDLTVKADWMVVAEKGKAFEYSDFTPEQIAILKGDKGDPFLYSDFTPEQIAELQQPAADAIASIQAVELAVEQAEALRVTAEQDRQTNTATAIQNAETATTNASNAAILANEKAGLADAAAANANTKATLADNAATNANTKAGLADTAATTANNARLAIQADLAAKEATANKQNSLALDGTGTKFPTVDAVKTEIITNEQIEAEVENVLDARIAALEALIANGIYGASTINKMDVVDEFNIHGITNLILKGTTAPSITPDFIGQTYINTTAGVTYTAKGITNSGDWKQTSN